MPVSRFPVSCSARTRTSMRTSRSLVHVPVPFPVLDPYDVIEVLTRTHAVAPGCAGPAERSVSVVLCDAAYEVITVLVVNDVPPDGADAVAALLVAALGDDTALAERVARVVLVLGRGTSTSYPDDDELTSWAGLDHRLGALEVEVADLLTVTALCWSSMSLDHGTGWYDGTGLAELLARHSRLP